MEGLTDPGLALYVAAAVAVVVWLGIFGYLWRIDTQARALRQRLDERKLSAPAAAPAVPVRPERVKTEQKEPHNV